jgi:adenylylsulfate kinase
MKNKSKGMTLWFFGLPAAGKSTMASRVVRDLENFVLLDGDEVRKTVTNFNMDQNARLMHLSYMAYCCRQLNDCGISVAAAFVTPLNEHRARIREILPGVKFVWIRCAQETCVARDPKGLWKKAAQGNLPHLTGAGGEWENPTAAALTIQSDALSVEESFAVLKKHFGL